MMYHLFLTKNNQMSQKNKETLRIVSRKCIESACKEMSYKYHKIVQFRVKKSGEIEVRNPDTGLWFSLSVRLRLNKCKNQSKKCPSVNSSTSTRNLSKNSSNIRQSAKKTRSKRNGILNSKSTRSKKSSLNAHAND